MLNYSTNDFETEFEKKALISSQALEYNNMTSPYKARKAIKMDVEDLSLILSTIYELTIGTDVTELVKSVSPVYFEKLLAVAKEAASAYKAEDFEGNALKGYELITK